MGRTLCVAAYQRGSRAQLPRCRGSCSAGAASQSTRDGVPLGAELHAGVRATSAAVPSLEVGRDLVPPEGLRARGSAWWRARLRARLGPIGLTGFRVGGRFRWVARHIVEAVDDWPVVDRVDGAGESVGVVSDAVGGGEISVRSRGRRR